MKAAYLIRDGTQLRNPAKPFLIYDALVSNAALKRADFVGFVKPTALILASFNPTMVPKAGPTNPFYIALRAAMAPYTLKDAQGQPVIESEYGEVFYDWRMTGGAVALADWIHANCDIPDIYIDDCTARLPLHKKQDLPDQSVAAFFPVWRDTFIDRLRELIPARLIVVNSGGWTSRAVNGVCIEAGHRTILGTHITSQCYVMQASLARIAGRQIASLDWSATFEEPEQGIYRGVMLP